MLCPNSGRWIGLEKKRMRRMEIMEGWIREILCLACIRVEEDGASRTHLGNFKIWINVPKGRYDSRGGLLRELRKLEKKGTKLFLDQPLNEHPHVFSLKEREINSKICKKKNGYFEKKERSSWYEQRETYRFYQIYWIYRSMNISEMYRKGTNIMNNLSNSKEGWMEVKLTRNNAEAKRGID